MPLNMTVLPDLRAAEHDQASVEAGLQDLAGEADNIHTAAHLVLKQLLWREEGRERRVVGASGGRAVASGYRCRAAAVVLQPTALFVRHTSHTPCAGHGLERWWASASGHKAEQEALDGFTPE